MIFYIFTFHALEQKCLIFENPEFDFGQHQLLNCSWNIQCGWYGKVVMYDDIMEAHIHYASFASLLVPSTQQLTICP